MISQKLSEAAMVRRWSAYIHPRLVWSQVWVLAAVVVGRSGAQVRRASSGRN